MTLRNVGLMILMLTLSCLINILERDPCLDDFVERKKNCQLVFGHSQTDFFQLGMERREGVEAHGMSI